MTFGKFPATRMRRNRAHEWLRDLVAESVIVPSDLILPIFVIEGESQKQEVKSMPEVYRLSVDYVIEQVREAISYGIKAVALFPVVDKKTECAEEAYNPENLLCRAVRAIKNNFGDDIGVICDIALDPYTSHGHDGILKNGYVENDVTVEILCKQAVICAEAGCDMVAPSDMMDGRIGAIRAALDGYGLVNTGILSYAVKYASGLYGPFRDAVNSSSALGKADKKTYQMNPANALEAIMEAALDIEEGADIIMVKPAMLYLDVIHRLKSEFSVPIFAYQVSGEYSMLRTLDNKDLIMESLIAIKRAGASAIFTYSALDVAKIIRDC